MRKAFIILFLSLCHFVSISQIISTFAGVGISGNDGNFGLATAAKIFPVDGVFDKNGNFYFTQGTVCDCVRKISISGIITNVAGGGIGGDGILATLASLNNPQRITVDTAGNLYIAESGKNRIRKVDISTNIITTIAGVGLPSFSGDGGPAILASLNYPLDIVFDDKGELLIADAGNNRVRKISNTGEITTIAGNGSSATATIDGVPATSTGIGNVQGLAIDKNCNIYLGIYGRLRKVDTQGIITTLAGNGIPGFSPDGTFGNVANINVQDIAIDKDGNIFLSERSNNRVRYIDNSGMIRTLAGNGVAGYSGDGFSSFTSQINTPGGVILDTCGNVLICDALNFRIRKVIFPKCHFLNIDINDIDNKSNISLFPSYASDLININSNYIYGIIIYDLFGRCVFNSDFKAEKNVSLNISQLPSGMYFVRVNDRYAEKFIKE